MTTFAKKSSKKLDPIPGTAEVELVDGTVAREKTYAERDEPESRSGVHKRFIHRIFQLGVLAQGVDGALELIGGLLLLSQVLALAAVNWVYRSGTTSFVMQQQSYTSTKHEPSVIGGDSF